MKQTKWQRLATIGLCSSLVINAFSGVTAVAETITIESSPTVASSAKEATSASSATPESTESSQETTETSREEVTQETEKQEVVKEEHKEETEAKKQEEETVTSEVVQPNPVLTPTPVSGIGVRAGNLTDIHQQLRVIADNFREEGLDKPSYKVTVPETRLGVVFNSLDNTSLNMTDFDITAKTAEYLEYYTSKTWSADVDVKTIKTNNSIDMVFPQKELSASASFVSNTNTRDLKYKFLKPINITFPKYIENIQLGTNEGYHLFSLSRVSVEDVFGMYNKNFTINYTLSKLNDSSYTLSTDYAYQIMNTPGQTSTRIYELQLFNNRTYQGYSDNTFQMTVPKKDINLNVTHKKVTESFKDTAGATIPAPTGFTQGKQTSITSNNYTFKQAGTLPETYKASNGKTYKFKGWYKGKTKPNTLTTTKAPSYAVTYDDNDDLNVVYEEAFEFPEETFQFGFVNQDGQLVKSDDITIAYDYSRYLTNNGTNTWNGIDLNQKAITDGKLKKITMPKSSMPLYVGEAQSNGEAMINISFSLPKYYTGLNIYNKSGKIDSNYPLPPRHYYRNNQEVIGLVTDAIFPGWLTLAKAADNSYVYKEALTSPEPVNSSFPMMRRGVTGYTYYYSLDAPVYYHLTQRKVTENFVDATGAKITPPTGFTQGKQTGIDSDPYTFKQAGTLPDTYKAGTKTYKFKGWYKGKTKPNTLTTSTTPAYNTTFDDNDDMTAVYKEANISANLTMRGAVDVIDNGATMEYWEVLLKNTGEAPLTSVKIKPTTDWAAGISTPTELFILGTGQNTKVRPITKEQWEAGFEIPLDSSLPVGGQLTINLLGTKVTGQPNQVLKAAVEVTGNFNKLTASDTVRIKDLDQETKEPTGEGFISVPTFNFGQVGVAGSTQQHSLKKAADYYGNGTRNPYLRIKKTQPNWSLTAQLSQPKSATDSLPTTTRLLLGTAAAASFTDYNQQTETKTPLGKTGTVNLTADNTATAVVANQQFTGSDVYQLDFTFANIKLEVPANQGMVGQQYQAAVTWNLVTGP
ncbi:WxL domain-containing protein [Enterococcus sp. AZ159]|uniref:WxL domain-containing protein n=1 Tax=Enterococcus sp. AZ159 TaxID=2774867 RepID=UPI003F2104F8